MHTRSILECGGLTPLFCYRLDDKSEDILKPSDRSIIDTKNPASSVLSKKLFDSDEERMKPESWDELVQPLLKDIENLMQHNLPIMGDSVNLAIIKDQNSGKRSIRVLGFDFTSKNFPLSPPSERVYDIKHLCKSDFENHKEEASSIFKDLVQNVIEVELEIDWNTASCFDLGRKAKNLAQKINDRFKNSFLKSCQSD